ncbi:MAG TPA: stage III sporulation protein AD [Pseudogracilibacillus sp.]|nr:stage III sporulation protein AD [Pseudogracilibacillus sp.]
MDIIHIVLFAITSAMIYLIVKEVQPNIAFVILFITAIIIFIFIIEQVKTIISFIQILARKASIQTYYLDTIFKIIGIAYIVEIAANLVKDAGLSSLASKIELAGKIFILLLALPIIQAVIEMIIQFIPASSH